MLNFFQDIFGKKFIHNITESTYSVIKANFFLNVTLIPWIFLNIFLKFTTETLFIYLFVGVILYPGIMTFFTIDINEITFRDYLKVWKQTFYSGIKVGVISNLIFGILIAELFIVLSKPGFFYVVPFLIFSLMFVSTSIFHFLLLSKKWQDWKQTLKVSGYLSLRYVPRTMVIFLVAILFLGIYYIFPYLNLLLTGSLLLLVNKRLLTNTLGKVVNKERTT
ncbi:hypothetical protein [Enterococcus sp. JM9B]|uniref:hypothetical protein n=1 Tax=Enterococcus sp. JM9B TaxID=1857216 RepID=UPI001374AB6D|nr:hypothetical protein [Enterococcus sp. JM9B]KAF1301886.1 hypothetical protein BAU16_08360 [Enterococcus sp. JM9B]